MFPGRTPRAPGPPLPRGPGAWNGEARGPSARGSWAWTGPGGSRLRRTREPCRGTAAPPVLPARSSMIPPGEKSASRERGRSRDTTSRTTRTSSCPSATCPLPFRRPTTPPACTGSPSRCLPGGSGAARCCTWGARKASWRRGATASGWASPRTPGFRASSTLRHSCAPEPTSWRSWWCATRTPVSSKTRTSGGTAASTEACTCTARTSPTSRTWMPAPCLQLSRAAQAPWTLPSSWASPSTPRPARRRARRPRTTRREPACRRAWTPRICAGTGRSRRCCTARSAWDRKALPHPPAPRLPGQRRPLAPCTVLPGGRRG